MLRAQLRRAQGTEGRRNSRRRAWSTTSAWRNWRNWSTPSRAGNSFYETFNAWAERHPWVGQENIRLKSIAREMFEEFRSFGDYIVLRTPARGGVLLRHLNSVYKVLAQTVPDSAKTDTVREMEAYLSTMLRQVDSSLLEECGRRCAIRTTAHRRKAPPRSALPALREAARDVTRNLETFTASIRTRIFQFLRAFANGDNDGGPRRPARVDPGTTDPTFAAGPIPDSGAGTATSRIAGRGSGSLSPDTPPVAGSRGTESAPRMWCRPRTNAPGAWTRSWWIRKRTTTGAARFEADLAASRVAGQPVIRLLDVGPVGAAPVPLLKAGSPSPPSTPGAHHRHERNRVGRRTPVLG